MSAGHFENLAHRFPNTHRLVSVSIHPLLSRMIRWNYQLLAGHPIFADIPHLIDQSLAELGKASEEGLKQLSPEAAQRIAHCMLVYRDIYIKKQPQKPDPYVYCLQIFNSPQKPFARRLFYAACTTLEVAISQSLKRDRDAPQQSLLCKLYYLYENSVYRRKFSAALSNSYYEYLHKQASVFAAKSWLEYFDSHEPDMLKSAWPAWSADAILRTVITYKKWDMKAEAARFLDLCQSIAEKTGDTLVFHHDGFSRLGISAPHPAKFPRSVSRLS